MAEQIILDWTGARPIDLRGRKKVLLAAGLASKSGDAARQFASLARLLQREAGFSPGDLLEVTYRGRLAGESWTPLPYAAADCEASLDQVVQATARLLRWYAARLPADLEWHLVGYSLGGVAVFEAAAELLERDAPRWRGRIGSVVTLAAPLLGSDLGAEGDLLGIFGLGALVPGGAAGQELVARGRDPAHRARTFHQAELLRRHGVEVLTLADEYDVVVTPDEAVLAPPDQRHRYVYATSRALVGGPHEDNVFGHGPLLANPRALAQVAEAIGPQERR